MSLRVQTQLDPTELKHYPFNDPNGERNLSVAIGPRTPGLAFKFKHGVRA